MADASETPPEGNRAPATGDDVRQAVLRARLFPEVQAPRVGRYAVLEVLGQGGMGTVYACFDDKLDRRVAVKVIKGVASEDARVRMLREAQAMAKLSHPNVVPVFEVGEHEDQLFVAMEFVRGSSLHAWQQEAEHPWRDVLGNYLQAGRGLAAAHAEGLVHRDFKPHNAMVGEDGRVRVLDFGLAARGASPSDLETTAPSQDSKRALDVQLTETGAVMGTPAYMAPEQFEGGATDHRTDQFSFCVALWEGLYGTRPFAGDSISAILEHIERGDLPLPDTTEVPDDIGRTLRRGLATDPVKRWPDLPALLDELERLDVDPASVRKRRQLLGGVLLGLPALGGAVVGGQAWMDSARTQDCEAQARSDIERHWNDQRREEVRAALLGTGVDFAETTADRVLPTLENYALTWQSAASDACVATEVDRTWSPEQLRRARWCLEERELDLGALVGALAQADRDVINTAVVAASNLASVAPCSDPAMLNRLPSPPDEAQKDAADELRELLSKAGALASTGQFDAAQEAAQAGLDAAAGLDASGSTAKARSLVGKLQGERGDYETAAKTLEDAYFEATAAHDFVTALEAAIDLTYIVGERLVQPEMGLHWSRLAQAAIVELELPKAHPLATTHLTETAGVHRMAGDYAQARELYERALPLQTETLGESSPIVAATTSNVAGTMMYMGEPAEAKAMQQRALELQEAAYGADHPRVGNAIAMLGSFHFALGEYKEAEPVYVRALEVTERALGPEHSDVASILNNLGNVHDATGRPKEAVGFHRRALAIREAMGPEHAEVAESLNNMGIALASLGEYDQAKEAYGRALAIRLRVFGPTHPTVGSVHDNLGNLHYLQEDYVAAVPAYRHALEIYREAYGDEHPRVASGLYGLGQALDGAGKPTEARAPLEQALALREKAYGPDHPEVGSALNALGSVLVAAQEYTEAKSTLMRALEIWEKALGEDHPNLSYALENLGKLHAATGDEAAAIRDYTRALKILETADTDPQRRTTISTWLTAHR